MVKSDDLIAIYHVAVSFGFDAELGKSKVTIKFSFCTRCALRQKGPGLLPKCDLTPCGSAAMHGSRS